MKTIKKILNIKQLNIFGLKAFLIYLLLCLPYSISYSQDVLNLTPNSVFYISPDAQVGIQGNVNVATTGSFETNADNLLITGDINNSGSFTNSATITLTGDLNNSNSFTMTSGLVQLNGATSQTFTSLSELTVYDLALIKTGGDLMLDVDTKVDNNIYLIANNSKIELNEYDLTVAADGDIFTDFNGSVSFTAARCISNSSGTLGGALIFEINQGSPIQEIRLFPLGTPGVYTPGKITLNNCSFDPNAYFAMRAIDIEHPRVEKSPASLTKYWNVYSDNINISNNGADLIFYYDALEVNGNESAFIVMYYKPAYPDASGYWRVDPGLSNQVAWWGNYRFYTQETDTIDGDWSAGEEVAAISTYYSRANGDYNDNTTWSKDFFGGPISNTIPNKQSDRVRISNNSVTITEAVAAANIVSVEADGELVFTTEDYIHGDTARVDDGAKLIIASEDGITESAFEGNIRSYIRDLSEDVIYQYSGTFTPQQSGDGLPSNISCLMIDKPDATMMQMNKIIEVIDSLVITRGSLDIGSYSINGKSSGREFVMREGELIIRGAFPLNYDPPTFTSGTITFWKDGANTYVNIPSTLSSPAAVNQYKNLVIKGNRTGASAVTFSSAGETVINGIFDISNLEFDTSIPRFNMDGSVLVYNQDGGTQEIPCSPGSVDDSIRNIEYYDLQITGAGTKVLSSPFTPTFVVVNDITLESSTFSSNGYNLEVNQNWYNTGGIFDPGTDAVILNAPIPIFTNDVTSRTIIDNPFYDIVISGTGIIQPTDDILVNNDIKFLTSSRMTMPSSTITTVLDLKGNWINEGGTFTPGSSTVTFTGTSSQTMTNTAAGETFNTLVVNNVGEALYATAVGPSSDYGVHVNEYLDLSNGILFIRDRYAQVVNDVVRTGATPGHVDGSLRKTIVTGATSNTFSVGYGTIYTPVILDFNGTGGTEGTIDVLSDTLTTTTSPIATTGAAITPAGSNIDDTKNIRRQYTVSIPSDSTFELGDERTYDATLAFIPGNSPVGDIRGAGDYDQFDVRLWDGADWIGPDRYGQPRTGTRTTSSTQFSLLTELGTFIVGEPEQLSFYSIGDGSWSTASNWSTQHYYGDPTNIVPTDDAFIYVGNSHTITVDGNKTVDGFVWIDSLGTLMTETYILSGTGDFYLQNEGALGVGDANGITSAGANGNIQTTSRDYNVDDHNRGHFIYTNGTNDQPSGDGLPTTVATLTVNKSGGSALRLTNNMVVTDSLSIPNGTLLSQEPGTATARDIELNGNLNIGANGSFDPYQGDFSFINSTSQTVTSLVDIDFYDLSIINSGNSQRIWFRPTASGMNTITIENSLVFAPTNLAYIDLSPTTSTATGIVAGTKEINYNSGEWIMTIDQSASGVSRLGEGHISGELRKWVSADGITEMMFEVGHDSVYSPFAWDFDNAGGTAGYVGLHCVPTFHPHGDELIDEGYRQARVLQKYWRASKPFSGTFAQGSRDMAFRARYRDPEDIPGGALKKCFDISYWKGATDDDWQVLEPPGPDGCCAAFNDGSASSCGDRIYRNSDATYAPYGTDTSTTAWDIDGSSITLSNEDLGLASNNRRLVGDFIVGQQGPEITYYYSKNDGAWNDPNTWVTHNLDEEAGYDEATNDGDWPKRRLDVAKIGNGKTVTLNCNIGTGYSGAYLSEKFFEQRLGSCIVEETAGGQGKLILNTFQIRASVFELRDGGILSSGGEDGFHEDLSRGNIIRQYINTTIARDLNFEDHDNGNFEFTALGKISETYNQGTYENYCECGGGWNTSGRYIDDIYIDDGASYSNPDVYAYENTGNQKSDNSSGFRYFSDTTIRLTAGNTYTVRVNTAGSSGSPYYAVMWLDLDFSGAFANNATEEFPNGGQGLTGNYSDITFTVPDSTPQGTTRMRFKVRYNAIESNPCYDGNDGGSGNGYGEIEDYTVYITRDNYITQQLTGGGVPNQVASVTVNTDKANGTVSQTSSISIGDDLIIENGTFIPTTYPTETTDFNEYLLVSDNEEYEQLTDDTTPTLSGGDADDGYYSNLPIGFDFPYHGSVYTTVGASTNGFLTFGTAAAVPTNDLENNGGGARPLIAPLWDDLDLTSGSFSYKTEGVSPDRTFVAQWQDVEWSGAAGSPVISFQVKLYESNGTIAYHYTQEATAVNSGSASIGLTASSTGNDNFLSLDGTGIAPGTSTSVSTNNLNTKPIDEQIYRFEPTSAGLYLQGDFTNNASTTAFGYGTEGTIEFDNEDGEDQEIKGSSTTEYYNVQLNNDEESIVLMTDATVNNWLSFKGDNFLRLNQNTLTMGEDAEAISPYSDEFSNSRMIMSGTSGTVGSVIKEFNTIGGAKEYFFPIGSGEIYNPADISVTGSYSGTPSIAISLYSQLHPARLKDEMLNKYWNLDLTDITTVTSNTFSFKYEDADVNGNNARYIPSLYQTNNEWEINTGLLPKAYPTPIVIENTSYIEGDWTAGEADVFFIGRVFYSINTGDWNESTNWSNDKVLQHNGPPSSYYPSELYVKDTVILDGHVMDYNLEYGIIDTMKIGGSNLGLANAGRGILDFTGTAAERRTLEIDRNLEVDIDGTINSAAAIAGGRRDTLVVNESIFNEADGTAGIDGGFYLNQGNDDYVILKFSGDESSTVTGEGYWGNPLIEIHLSKEDGLSDSLTCKSNSFAAATGTDPFLFYFNSGVLSLSESSSSLSLPDATFTLSSGTEEISMEPNSGINVVHGLMQSKQTVNTNIYTTLNVDNGGIFEVGDAVDEHLLYQTGTEISVLDGWLDVAGSFEKVSYKYVINCEIGQNGVFRVLNKGNTNIANKGFNVSNESSTFSMDGGRVIISQSSNSSSNDYEVSSGTGLGMINGATIQIGDSAIAPPAQSYKIAGTTPMYNLHYVGNSNTNITQQNLYINNDWTIDDFHYAELNDNTVYLAGNFQNSGTFDAHSADLTTDARQLILTGSSNTQTIYNKIADGLDLYNLRINKAGGEVLLGTDNSFIEVRNTLEFTLNNNAVINAAQNSQYIELSPAGSSNPLVSRNGYGHVNGMMYRYFEPGNDTKKFDVGGDTASSSYRPVTIEAQGAGGTAGLIGVMPYNTDHTELGNSTIKTTTNVPRYWNVSYKAPFDLGTRTYDITTQWENPGDLRNSPNLVFFEHGFYSPPLPSGMPPSDWEYPQVLVRTDTTVTTVNNDDWGDFVAGEPLGIFFYSYNSGDWYDANSWSLDGYTTKTSPITHLPGQGLNDFVKIGNGKRITLPAGGPYPTLKSVEVEVYNNLPGEFFIGGEIGYVKGDRFELEDSCTIAVQNLTGLEGAGNNGAVRMSTAPYYGVSRYVYNSSYGPQISGKAMPALVKSLLIDNTSSPPNNRVFISTYAGAADVEIIDSLYVNYGELNCGNRDIHLYGNMYMLNNAVFDPLSRVFSFESSSFTPAFNRLTLGNEVGVNFYDLNILDLDLMVSTETGYDDDSSHIYIENTLEIDNVSDLVINVRENDRKVIINNGATLVRTQNTGYVDGILQKPIGAGVGSYFYEIGNGSSFTPATITFDAGAGGSAGGIDGVNLDPVPFEPNYGNRLDPNKSVPRYWSMTTPDNSTFVLGARTFNLNLQFPASELIPVNTTKAAVRRKSIPAENPLWSQRFGGDLVWNAGLASVEISPLPTVQWPGLGEFYVGEKLPRTFYSRQTGVWDDYETWTFESTHVGPTAPVGEYPNLDESELNDNVVVGLDHIVTLNIAESKIDTLLIRHDSKLDMLSNTINCFDCPSSGLFEMLDNGTISFEGLSQPSNTSTMLNFAQYICGANSTVEFYGTQTLTPDPFGLGQYDGNVLVNLAGTKIINTPLLIYGNLTISNNAILLINNVDAARVLSNVINSATLENHGVLEIGTP